MAYQDVTAEIIDSIEGDANDQVFLTIRDFVKVMIEGGQGRRKQRRKPTQLHPKRVKAINDANDLHAVEDYDAFYFQWEASKYKRAAEASSFDDENEEEKKRKQTIFTALDVAKMNPVRKSSKREYFGEKIKRK
ncbi:hypothetical protein [Paenibacillus flagellatus]|uniref:Uncharacterized protein n=1 Tax=Paenibacillus flagellatus TaxID=2211139 RepID=A0A2V5JU29_9BACL|nr:hypothetical protein [Paenibacillus flagellatus]PYI49948.1 hypothetical protein DLM86_31490 [Paenibacillus flagellatus]